VALSIQVAILKVLSSHPDGHATISSINADIALLTRSGREWADRLKRLASRAPALDIFSCGYVVRDGRGWTITPAGRDFLITLEAVPQDNQAPQPVILPAMPELAQPDGTLIVIGRRMRPRRRRPANQIPSRTA